MKKQIKNLKKALFEEIRNFQDAEENLRCADEEYTDDRYDDRGGYADFCEAREEYNAAKETLLRAITKETADEAEAMEIARSLTGIRHIH